MNFGSIKNFVALSVFTALFIIHLFTSNRGYSATQMNLENSSVTIDSLLLEGDIKAVKLKYDNHEFEYYNSKELEVLFRNLHLVTTFDSSTIDAYVSHYETLSAQFNMEYVGQNAYKAYEKFIKLSLQNEKVDALNFYYISLFFKIHYFTTTLKSARNIYTHAYRYFMEEKYSEALETINSIKLYSGHNIQLIAIEDSLKLLRKNIIHKQIEYNRWHKTDLRTYKLFIGIIPSIINYGTVTDITLKVDNALSSFFDGIRPSKLNEIHIRNIPSTIKYELSLSINYLVFKKLMIGLDFGYTAFSISNDNNDSADEDNIFYKFKLKSYILKPFIKYLFSKKTGLSPFFNAGIGYQTIHYYDAIGGTYVVFPEPNAIKTDYGDLAMNSENRIGVISEIGAEYISSPSSHLIFGSKVGAHYFFSHSSIWNNYNITLSMYVGLIL